MNVAMKTDDHRTVTTAGTLPQSGAIRHGSWTGRHCCEARPTLAHYQSIEGQIISKVDDLNYSRTEQSSGWLSSFSKKDQVGGGNGVETQHRKLSIKKPCDEFTLARYCKVHKGGQKCRKINFRATAYHQVSKLCSQDPLRHPESGGSRKKEVKPRETIWSKRYKTQKIIHKSHQIYHNKVKTRRMEVIRGKDAKEKIDV
ncbi:hypothetical protein PHYBLDRAFT_185599 [Phycomyces blakesleeanus NRRL 1555(-)]|uniref:Uncharacterized protein n=1 Tax=Phycomyces blakesleeanus (strain ATCC 8743b / DSM 1359 / FGSC 10004 / NBRC 33097 / NRRL 1555) TaxID=763407 RepID=A0A167PDG8_PHYB8|nr:hypothetical protein PHYBLDRAFT_185599 [Phycomyces blakesleeanus NRRL 1555(-)]OAD77714.1 hypothetical protein PHYBLDRAFT_185599 [Phycomyces blakesleeanus NRRL 1555(-)]|eukprot:XP_018295754.1 hypothetical protein PHYBLDRAFT_185599 [Phycomyces blakesleeanus NRRL 1555(-)]